MLQLSVLALSAAAAVILAVPLVFRYAVKLALGRIIGLTESITVTTTVAVAILPIASVAVKVKLFKPAFAQVNAVWLKLILLKVQLSVVPLLTAAAVILAVPVVLK